MSITYQVLGLTPSFGFGDRTGWATPGHVAAMKKSGAGIAPIFAQQSIREMARTGRKPAEVIRDATLGAEAAGWTGLCGADADHLKSEADIELTSAAGFTFFTLDPSANVDQKADGYTPLQLEAKWQAIQHEITWVSSYLGRRVKLSTGTEIVFDEHVCKRAAVKYGKAITLAIRLGLHVAATRNNRDDFEIELSVDETDQPTTLAEHYIIADQCLQAGVKLISLAPRFVGDFEKGIDFKGDLSALKTSLYDHAAIAKKLGPYKLSLHSGSDKLSMYRMFADATQGCFHVKTAGTSYLEALRVLANNEPDLFAEIVRFARSRYETDKATYHVSAQLSQVPDVDDLPNPEEVTRHYLGYWHETPRGKGFTQPGRQILHCTFGSVLNHVGWGPAFRETLARYTFAYNAILEEHFSRHLDELRGH